MTSLHFAPVQGHTDAAYRSFHHAEYGGDVSYYTPFIRWERGAVRTRDEKDFSSPLNDGVNIIPQIIFRDAIELEALVSKLKNSGAKRIDLNMGCPFPLQTGHGRGAAAVSNENLGSSIVQTIQKNPDVEFSVKMRLGMSDPEEWKALINNLNQVDLSQIAVHPRVAKQQYSGDLNMKEFQAILDESVNPIIFNGEIKSPDDMERILSDYPKIAGIMIGRGILGRPSLFAEFAEGKWDKARRVDRMLAFHKKLLTHYEDTLCGESQIISKIKPFWEYAEEDIGHKAWKSIKKAGNMAKYHSAVALI